MNRLFIIGNGFDIAHGLKTKYCDFINDFWKNIKIKYQNREIDNLIILNSSYFQIMQYSENQINSYNDFFSHLHIYVRETDELIFEQPNSCKIVRRRDKDIIFRIQNRFLEIISQKQGIQNWVDIEKEYYYQLKEIVKNDSTVENKYEQVKILNEEFEQIKNLFEKYLDEKVNPEISRLINNKEIYNYFKLEEHKYKILLDKYLEEFPSIDHKLLREINNKILNLEDRDIISKVKSGEIKHKTVFLNFNYTNVIEKYFDLNHFDFFEHIQIHGKIGDKNNEINFGFGDEMDEDYRMIENLNENEFLRNFKSFGYSQNSNYKKLLDFVDSDKFQVIIMGHSCGISDRTMLNTIFEHPNCRSIKPFYHQWKNDEGFIHDNYTELVQNISRHFNKKKLMREKVVNKSLCKPLIPVK